MNKRECLLKMKALLTTIKRKVDYISDGKNEIFIFGAGSTSKLYEKCFAVENISIAGFLDNDSEKHGKPFLNRGGGGFYHRLTCKDVKMFWF